MKKLLEQAEKLVVALQSRISEYDKDRASLHDIDKKLIARKVELDDFEIQLIKRESDIKPVENLNALLSEVKEAKAKVDFEQTKLNGERSALETIQGSFAITKQSALQGIEDQKALYNRGAEENAKMSAKLKEKLDAIDKIKAGV